MKWDKYTVRLGFFLDSLLSLGFRVGQVLDDCLDRTLAPIAIAAVRPLVVVVVKPGIQIRLETVDALQADLDAWKS